MDHSIFFYLWIAFGAALAAAVIYGSVRAVPSLYWKMVVCLAPILLSALVVGQALARRYAGEGGFKLGVDLVGGTILVYEIDPDRKPPDFDKDKLAAALKCRIDPSDLYNVTIRPVSDTRVEIILPTGGVFQAQQAEKAWQEVLQKVQDHYRDQIGTADLEVARGQPDALAKLVYERIDAHDWAGLKTALIAKYPKLAENEDFKKIEPGQVNRLEIEAEKTITDNKPSEETRKAIDETVTANYKPTKIEDIDNFIKTVYGAGRHAGT